MTTAGPEAPPDLAEPPLAHPPYRSTTLRAPHRRLVPVPETLTEETGPVFGHDDVGPLDHDLTRQGTDEPQGQRIIVHGTVSDHRGHPLRAALVEVWQANAAGRYAHQVDQHPAPLDPNFWGGGRCLTDDDGHYQFVTIRPGAYPWGNHDNAWRPAHIHFSVFGTGVVSRLVTQMYFPGDPLFDLDPIFCAVPERARGRLVSSFDLGATVPEWALGYRFDLVLRGPGATPFEGTG
ncbi:MAG TPA: protocatechuate 3,4-dioxygenase subunit beta [Acidimicrobiales bacterium]|jgi:protocatechuate 3,4-dioxygenase beta subunit|nr:protocatechuate 3,4-dioxygenase subunit beta [Acidimicrobiales bacterium]